VDSHRAFVQRLGLREATLLSIKLTQIAQHCTDLRVIGPLDLLANRESPLIERLRLSEPKL